jgi:Domain of unknown function (DUF4136)
MDHVERKSMIPNKRLAFFPVFLFMIACAYGQDVHYNYDHSAKFAAYKSYEWVDLPGPGGAVPDQLIDQAIKRAVDEQLSQKGLMKVERDGYLKIGYHAIIREEKGVDLSGFGTGVGPLGPLAGGLGGWYSGTITGQTSSIPVGTLVVDLYDPIRKQLVWRGDVTKTVDLNKSPDRNYGTLQKAMRKLFKNYPPALNK